MIKAGNSVRSDETFVPPYVGEGLAIQWPGNPDRFVSQFGLPTENPVSIWIEPNSIVNMATETSQIAGMVNSVPSTRPVDIWVEPNSIVDVQKDAGQIAAYVNAIPDDSPLSIWVEPNSLVGVDRDTGLITQDINAVPMTHPTTFTAAPAEGFSGAIGQVINMINSVPQNVPVKFTATYSDFNNIPGMPTGVMATGGRPDPGAPYLIGEKGPEIWVPDVPGTILPNSDLRAMMGTGGSGTPIGTGGGGNVYNTYYSFDVGGSVLTDRDFEDLVHDALLSKRSRAGDLRLV